MKLKVFLLGVVLSSSEAHAYRGVIYLGEADPRPAEEVAGDVVDLPRVVFVLTERDAQGEIAVAAAEMQVGSASVVPELAGARVPDQAETTVDAPLGELSFAITVPVDVSVPSAGRYLLTLLMTPGPEWEEGRVRILIVGRKVHGEGPDEFKRETAGWFLVRP